MTGSERIDLQTICMLSHTACCSHGHLRLVVCAGEGEAHKRMHGRLRKLGDHVSSLLLDGRLLGFIPFDLCMPDVAVSCSLRCALQFSVMTSHMLPFANRVSHSQAPLHRATCVKCTCSCYPSFSSSSVCAPALTSFTSLKPSVSSALIFDDHVSELSLPCPLGRE